MEGLERQFERARDQVRDHAARLLGATTYMDALRWSLALEDSATELTNLWLQHGPEDDEAVGPRRSALPATVPARKPRHSVKAGA